MSALKIDKELPNSILCSGNPKINFKYRYRDGMDSDGNRAPSLILYYKDSVPADILTQDVLVPTQGSANCTYYCCLCWNSGENGGGYCGIQDHPDGKCYIFSIWDPHNSSEPITAPFKGSDTKAEKFGGEGTGLKSMNFGLGWKPDHWYTLVTRRWDHHGHTRFGFWVHDLANQKWSHLVTMDFPEPDIVFHKTTSFLEDWYGNGHLLRCVKYRNGQKRSIDGSWHLLKTADFYVNQEDACRQYNNSFNACVDSGCYFMQSGQTTCPEQGLCTTQELSCSCSEESDSHSSTQEPSGTCPVQFSIEAVSRKDIAWRVDESETPQFKYTIKDGTRILFTETDSEKRSCDIDISQFTNAVLLIEDILGRETQIPLVINQPFRYNKSAAAENLITK